MSRGSERHGKAARDASTAPPVTSHRPGSKPPTTVNTGSTRSRLTQARSSPDTAGRFIAPFAPARYSSTTGAGPAAVDTRPPAGRSGFGFDEPRLDAIEDDLHWRLAVLRDPDHCARRDRAGDVA